MRIAPFSRVIVLAGLMLLVSGCKVTLEQSTVVNEDGSGTATVVVALDEEFRSLLESTGQDVDGFAESFDERFDVTPFDDGEFTGVRAVTTFEDPTELNDLLAATPAIGQASEQISLTKDGRSFEFGASLGNVAEQIGEVAGAGDFIDAESFDDIFDISILMKLPGELQSHNADEVRADGTLVWNLTSVSDGELQASAETPVAWTIYIIAGGVIGALVGIAAMRSRRPTPTLAEEPDTEIEV